MPTLPTGRQSADHDEELIGDLTVRLGRPGTEILDGATDHQAGDNCPCCTTGTLYGKPPYQCRECGWSSIQTLYVKAPYPKAPLAQHAFDDPDIHPHRVADDHIDLQTEVETRLIAAGYLGYPVEYWRLRPCAWQTQYDHYGRPDLFAYLLRDAITTFVLISAADAGYSDLDAYRQHVTTRPRQDIGCDPAKNTVATLDWLESIDAPTDPQEVSIP